jgi:hypothetical protein
MGKSTRYGNLAPPLIFRRTFFSASRWSGRRQGANLCSRSRSGAAQLEAVRPHSTRRDLHGSLEAACRPTCTDQRLTAPLPVQGDATFWERRAQFQRCLRLSVPYPDLESQCTMSGDSVARPSSPFVYASNPRLAAHLDRLQSQGYQPHHIYQK